MNPYRYTVSLRIRHPKKDPNTFTEKLKIEPKHTKINSTYWSAKVTTPVKVNSQEIELETQLENLVNKFKDHSTLFKEIVQTKGEVEFFIGIFSKENFGLSFSPKLLNRLSELNIQLAFDIYPN